MKWLSDATLAHLCKVADAPDLSGTRYELVEKLGQGGMGTVYLAHDRELDRQVALKVLRCDDGESTTRMVKEARIIARLEHPSIVPVHDCGLLPDGRFFYAMKVVRGKRLDEQLARPIALADRLQLFQKICDAVAFAHAHGVIHRDLKPQNIMLGAFGEVMVMDWGIAREAGDHAKDSGKTSSGAQAGPGVTAHGTIVGTPGYMAPEQARGDVELIDERADVYALGAILYFLLTGQAPAHDGAPSVLVPPRRLDGSIPRPLQAACLKALAVDRTQRYTGAAELAADVANFLAGRRVGAYPETIGETILRLISHYRIVLGLILAYVLMRVLLLLFTE
jgi:serine/threonine protein kinase